MRLGTLVVPLSAAASLFLASALESHARDNSEQCHSTAIKSRPGSGLLPGTAQSRARSAWIKAVRAHKKLGPSYAAWLRAKEPSYSCRRANKRHVCVATAIPCRLPDARPNPPRSHK